VDDIVSVRVERGQSNHADKQLSTRDSLVFVTPKGPADLLQVDDMFVRDAPAIQAFLADRSRADLSLSSTSQMREKLRFVFAQLVGALLVLGGAGLVMSGVRGLAGAR
jgi:hypothetical protein